MSGNGGYINGGKSSRGNEKYSDTTNILKIEAKESGDRRGIREEAYS